MFSVYTEQESVMVIDEEQTHNDRIFNTDGINFSNKIVDDIHYSKPAIKTWIYTNISDIESKEDYWVDIEGMPIAAEYKDGLNFYNGNIKKGVFVITSYMIPVRNLRLLETMIPVITGKLTYMPQEVREKIKMKFRERLASPYSGQDLKFRLINFIPKDLYDDNDFIQLGNIKTSTNIENLYRNGVPEDRMFNSGLNDTLYLELTYFSRNTDKLSININKTHYDLKAIDTPFEDRLSIGVYGQCDGEFEYLFGKTLKNKELKNLSFFNNTGEETISKLIEHDTLRYNAFLAIQKLAMDNDTSLNKLLANEKGAYAAKLGIDKAELDLAKEGFKMATALL